MTPPSASWPVAAVLTAALAAVNPAPAVSAPGPLVAIGQPLREATMTPLNGKPRRLSEFRGQPLIINVWASWCGPCRAEAASLERLAWSGMPLRFGIIGISTDDDPRAAQAWLAKSNATISHFIDRALELESMLGANRIPLTLLVDAEGRVLERHYGAREWDTPESKALVTKAFGAKKAPAGGRAP